MSNLNKFEKAKDYLAEIIGNLSQELQILYSEDNLTLEPHTLLVRKDIKGASSRYQLIDSNTKKSDGISTLDGNKFDTGNAFIFDGVATAFKQGDDGNNLGELAYDAAFPNALRGAFLVITQNGRKVLDIPVADCYVKGTPQAPYEQYIQFPRFLHVADYVNFEMMLHFPEGGGGIPVTAGKIEGFELRAQGMLTVRRK